jgi:hypothetical protein
MKIIIVEGTPAEIEALPQLRQVLGMQAPARAGEVSGREEELEEPSVQATEAPVTAELLRKAFVRKAMHENQKAVIGAVYRSRDWISKEDLSTEAGIDETSIPGIIGGLGLRFSATRGWPKRKHWGRPSRLVIDMERRDGTVYYRAKDVFRQGVDLAHILNGDGR